ncbi:jacalin-related lectin 3-like [Typha latifolia]|uniref:jacalin-related lectin 3-like n=1 Tax=Typha latifolia TaxID=4733 RepID=UPI003C2D85B6
MNVGGVNRIKKLIVRHGEAIDAIRIMFERNGQPEWTPMWGGSGGGFNEINLGPDEHLISVDGYYGKFEDWLVIRLLTFASNRETYGPYGCQEGTPFSLPADNGQIIGFHSIQKKVLYGSQDLWDIMENDYVQPVNVTMLTLQQLNELKKTREKDKKTLFFIYQAMGETIFKRISTVSTVKKAWDTLSILQKRGEGEDGMASKLFEAISKMGPSGGSGGGAREMNVDGVSRINKLIVRHGAAIDAIRIMFERNGQPEWTPMWGGSGGGFTEVITTIVTLMVRMDAKKELRFLFLLAMVKSLAFMYGLENISMQLAPS